MEERTYTINEVAMMTGLSTRTLRNYLMQGLLQGEKTGGAWQFTAEALDRFFSEPFVKESIRIRRTSAVFDFLSDGKKETERTCVIMDIPCSAAEGRRISDFFCRQMEKVSDTEFSFGRDGGTCRVILSGAAEPVAFLMASYSEWKAGK